MLGKLSKKKQPNIWKIICKFCQERFAENTLRRMKGHLLIMHKEKLTTTVHSSGVFDRTTREGIESKPRI